MEGYEMPLTLFDGEVQNRRGVYNELKKMQKILQKFASGPCKNIEITV